MKFTQRMTGEMMATVKVEFHIGLGALVNAALHVVSFGDQSVPPAERVEVLTKAAIERELRMNLEASGDTFVEFGHEGALAEARQLRVAIVAKVADLYGLPVPAGYRD